MADLLQTIVEISVSAGFLIAALLLLLPILRRRYPARWRYYAWLVLAIRLLIPVNVTLEAPPVLLPLPATVTAVPPPAAQAQDVPPGQAGGSAQPLPEAIAAPAQPPVPRTYSAGEAAALIWLAGAAGLFLWEMAAYTVFRRRLERWSRPETDRGTLRLFQAACRAYGLGRVKLLRSREAPTPLAAGFLRPAVALPEADYTPEALRLIFRHELCHIRRRDTWYKLVMLAARCLHWFNPLVWLMEREADRAVEFSCDDSAAAGMSEEDRRRYCAVVLDAAGKLRGARLTTAFGGTKKALLARLKNILDTGKRRAGLTALCAVAVCAATVGLLVACGRKTQEAHEGSGPPKASAIAQSFPTEDPALFHRVDVERTPGEKQAIRDAVKRVLDACADVLATMPVEKDNDSEAAQGFENRMQARVAETGVPVLEGESMLNGGEVAAFYDAAKVGKDASVIIYIVHADEIIFDVFISSGGRVTYGRESVSYTAPDTIILGSAELVDTLEMTERGHLIFSLEGDYYTAITDSTGVASSEKNYNGYCVHPRDERMQALCDEYVSPAGGMIVQGALMTNWDADHLAGLDWAQLFQDVSRAETGKHLTDLYPAYSDEWSYVAVPARDLEETLARWYPVTAEELRLSGFYDPTAEAYYISAYPVTMAAAAWPEVDGVTENSDGSLTLEVRLVALPMGSDRECISRLTVMPQPGGFRYLSNTTDYAGAPLKAAPEKRPGVPGLAPVGLSLYGPVDYDDPVSVTQKFIVPLDRAGQTLMRSWKTPRELPADDLVDFCARNNLLCMPVTGGAVQDYVNHTGEGPLVEAAIRQYFDVPAEYLRTSARYEYDGTDPKSAYPPVGPRAYLMSEGTAFSNNWATAVETKRDGDRLIITVETGGSETAVHRGTLVIRLVDDGFRYESYEARTDAEGPEENS